MATGFPIVYTSATACSKLQPTRRSSSLDRLYELCEIARGLLQGELELVGS